MAKDSRKSPAARRYGNNVIRIYENPNAGVPGHLAAFFMGAIASIDFSQTEGVAQTRQAHRYDKASKTSGLPTNEHTFPRKSISRFCKSGVVALHDNLRDLDRPAKPSDAMFCARRAWDKRAEAGYMKSIEDGFQQLADEIIADRVTEIDDTQKHAVDYFFSLWYMRTRFKYLASHEITASLIEGQKYTQEQEENLERDGFLFAREGGKVPARQINGLQMEFRIRGYAEQIARGTQWGIIQAQEGEFIVPDVPTHALIPLTPTRCLVAAAPNGIILKGNVAEINRRIKADSREYFFAKDFSMCPC